MRNISAGQGDAPGFANSAADIPAHCTAQDVDGATVALVIPTTSTSALISANDIVSTGIAPLHEDDLGSVSSLSSADGEEEQDDDEEEEQDEDLSGSDSAEPDTEAVLPTQRTASSRKEDDDVLLAPGEPLQAWATPSASSSSADHTDLEDRTSVGNMQQQQHQRQKKTTKKNIETERILGEFYRETVQLTEVEKELEKELEQLDSTMSMLSRHRLQQRQMASAALSPLSSSSISSSSYLMSYRSSQVELGSAMTDKNNHHYQYEQQYRSPLREHGGGDVDDAAGASYMASFVKRAEGSGTSIDWAGIQRELQAIKDSTTKKKKTKKAKKKTTTTTTTTEDCITSSSSKKKKEPVDLGAKERSLLTPKSRRGWQGLDRPLFSAIFLSPTLKSAERATIKAVENLNKQMAKEEALSSSPSWKMQAQASTDPASSTNNSSTLKPRPSSATPSSRSPSGRPLSVPPLLLGDSSASNNGSSIKQDSSGNFSASQMTASSVFERLFADARKAHDAQVVASPLSAAGRRVSSLKNGVTTTGTVDPELFKRLYQEGVARQKRMGFHFANKEVTGKPQLTEKTEHLAKKKMQQVHGSLSVSPDADVWQRLYAWATESFYTQMLSTSPLAAMRSASPSQLRLNSTPAAVDSSTPKMKPPRPSGLTVHSGGPGDNAAGGSPSSASGSSKPLPFSPSGQMKLESKRFTVAETEMSFSPKISRNSEKLAATSRGVSPSPAWSRLYSQGVEDVRKRTEFEKARAEQERQRESELAAQFPFKPSISEIAQEIHRDGKYMWERITDFDGKMQREKVGKIASELREAKMKECTFQPSIPKRSKTLGEKARSASASGFLRSRSPLSIGRQMREQREREQQQQQRLSKIQVDEHGIATVSPDFVEQLKADHDAEMHVSQSPRREDGDACFATALRSP